jgi:hypothetical protein
MSGGEWYWCLDHNEAVTADHACAPDRRMGPYPTREAAEHWKDRVEAHNEAWEKSDREWSGEDED